MEQENEKVGARRVLGSFLTGKQENLKQENVKGLGSAGLGFPSAFPSLQACYPRLMLGKLCKELSASSARNPSIWFLRVYLVETLIPGTLRGTGQGRRINTKLSNLLQRSIPFIEK